MREYELIRSRRKTLALVVTRDGRLMARAPLKMPVAAVEAFLCQKEDWIAAKLSQAARRQENRQSAHLADGEQLPFLGQWYPIATGEKTPQFDGARFLLPAGEEALRRQAALGLYRQLATEVLAPRVAAWAQKTGLVPTSVKVGKARSRWGSCSGKNRLNFSCYL